MNHADLCRECELASRNRELERRLSEMAIEVVALTEENRAIKQAGTRLSNLIIEVLDNIYESALQDALENWEKVRRNKNERQVGI